MISDSSYEFSALQLYVTGRVQGVGFRPFVYKIAKDLKLNGQVYNSPEGITIHVEGPETLLKIFKERIILEKPQAASIKQIHEKKSELQNADSFKILTSQKEGAIITEICPDIAICSDCEHELKSSNRRINYPFNNCSHCGPRFTIMKDFPYDRERTSMREFKMCDQCEKEYTYPSDRRFHAQPVSCQDCGPTYSYIKDMNMISDNILSILNITEDLNEGKVVAIKGLGGYNLACNAFNNKAVKELRRFKYRERKPFAVLFKSYEEIEKLAIVNSEEKEALISWQRPIVILTLKEPRDIDQEITSGLPTIGAFLPYLPMQIILFKHLQTNAIILTSGNESDTPILYQEHSAIQTFRKLSGGVLSNNREIVRRIDDSVVRVIDQKPLIFRRARGYVPTPIDLNFTVDGILGAGAELSNCFCLGKNNQAIFSQHVGDLKNIETYEFYCKNIREFSNLYRAPIQTIACDLHPDYLSTRYAEESGFNIVFTQHHHAHIASVMAEYELNEPVIGISYDGVGLGTDGNIWGSEVFVADFDDFRRISHFEYVKLQGGDENTNYPWRSALAYLYHTFGPDWEQTQLPFLKVIDIEKARYLSEAIGKSINCIPGCSAGRLFDTISALLGICIESNYHAEAPMLLENYINPKITDHYTFSGADSISFKPMVTEIINDIQNSENTDIIVTRFHNTIAQAALQQAELAQKSSSINKVVLSGGCFQNKFLTEKLLTLLKNKGFETYIPNDIPVNDGGIALGQMAIAAHKKL